MSFRTALSHRAFASLVSARVVSRFGSSLHEIALIWLTLQQTSDARIVTLVVIASTLPNIILALPAGALVDRLDRRYVLVGANLFSGVAVLAIPLVGRGDQLVPVAITVALAVGVVETFSGPARTAVLPQTVPEEELDSANALFSLTSSVSRTLYVLGGGVVAFLGGYTAFYINSATFLIAAVLIATVPAEVGQTNSEGTSDDEAPQGPLDSTRSVLADARDGLVYVRNQPVVLSILAVGVLVGALSDPLGVIVPVLAEDTIGGGSIIYGILLGSIFAGMVVGDLGVSYFTDQISAARGLTVSVSLLIGGIALATIGVAAPQTPYLTVISVLGFSTFGIALSFATTPLDTLLQATVPDEMLGRVSSVFSVVGLIGPPVGLAITGPVVERFGPTFALAADGVFVVLAAILVAVPLVRFDTSGDQSVSAD